MFSAIAVNPAIKPACELTLWCPRRAPIQFWLLVEAPRNRSSEFPKTIAGIASWRKKTLQLAHPHRGGEPVITEAPGVEPVSTWGVINVAPAREISNEVPLAHRSVAGSPVRRILLPGSLFRGLKPRYLSVHGSIGCWPPDFASTSCSARRCRLIRGLNTLPYADRIANEGAPPRRRLSARRRSASLPQARGTHARCSS
jgi:hypothetical protein